MSRYDIVHLVIIGISNKEVLLWNYAMFYKLFKAVTGI